MIVTIQPRGWSSPQIKTNLSNSAIKGKAQSTCMPRTYIWWLFTACGCLSVALPSESLAGGGVATAESREAAIVEATVLMPSQASIVSEDCTVQSGDGMGLYTCTVEWEP